MKANRLHYSLTFDALSMEFMHIRFIDKKKKCDKDFFFEGGSLPIENGSYRKMTWQKNEHLTEYCSLGLRQGQQLIQDINWTDDL